MEVEEVQREVQDSKQVLNMGTEKAEARRGEGSEIFLSKVEGLEETRQAGNKFFRACSTRKYALVKGYFTPYFLKRKPKSQHSNWVSSGWILKTEGEGHWTLNTFFSDKKKRITNNKNKTENSGE